MIAHKALSIAVLANVPVFIWGKPGCAKTAYVRALAKVFARDVVKGAKFVTFIGSSVEPQDIGGIPMADRENGKVVRLLLEEMKTACTDPTLLFFDELTCTPPSTQAPMLRIINEREAGMEALHPETRLVFAMNPVEFAAGGFDLPAATANRGVHLAWDYSVGDYREAMRAGFPEPDLDPLPKDWEREIPRAAALVDAFLGRKPEHFESVPSDEAQMSKAFPTARTWTLCARLLAAARASGCDRAVRDMLVQGCIGEGAGGEFVTYVDEMDLPDPEELIADPSKFVNPKRGDKALAIITSVVHAVKAKSDKGRWVAGWNVLSRAADVGLLDVATLGARALARDIPKGAVPPTDALKKFTHVLKLSGAKPGSRDDEGL